MIAQKSNATSYPNTLDEHFVKLREKAHTACEGNSQATEHVWETLTRLLTNIGGLAIYLAFCPASTDCFCLWSSPRAPPVLCIAIRCQLAVCPQG